MTPVATVAIPRLQNQETCCHRHLRSSPRARFVDQRIVARVRWRDTGGLVRHLLALGPANSSRGAGVFNFGSGWPCSIFRVSSFSMRPDGFRRLVPRLSIALLARMLINAEKIRTSKSGSLMDRSCFEGASFVLSTGRCRPLYLRQLYQQIGQCGRNFVRAF